MNVGVVVVQYYKSDEVLRRDVASFASLLKEHGIGAQEVRVDIRQAKGQASAFPFLDISGYRKGLPALDPASASIVLNDTFFIKHPWRSYTKALVKVLRSLQELDVPAAAGAVFPTQNLLLLDECNPTRRHVCTVFVAMNQPGRKIFEELVAGLPADEPVEIECWLDEVKRKYRALDLIFKLHFASTPNPWMWPALKGAVSPELIQRKKVTVAFEYLFSVALLQAGGVILPINFGTRQWLAEQWERLLLGGPARVLTALR